MTVVRCIAVEIAGWGVIGAEYPVESASSNGTTIAVRFVTASDATNFAGQLGADVRLPGSAVFPNRYTLLAQTSTFITLADDIGVVRADIGAISACVEDPYRICNEAPDWVADATPAARWLPVVSDVPPTLGASVPRVGGIGVVDRLSVKIIAQESATALRALWRTDAVGFSNDGRASLLTAAIDDRARSLTLDLPVALAAGYHLAYIDEEAISIYAPTTTTYSTLSIRRGVLGTVPGIHPAGSMIFSTPPTFIGARAGLAVYQSDSSGRADFDYSADCILDAPEYGDGSASYTLPLRTELLNAYSGGVKSRMTAVAKWDGIDVLIRQRDPFQTWRWVDVSGMAYRLIPTPVFTEIPETGEVDRRYLLDLWRGPANPVILDASLPRDTVLEALGFFAVNNTYSEFVVDETYGFAWVFRAQTIRAIDVVGSGDPVPCCVISSEVDTYATTPFETTIPQQLLSNGFAYTDVIGAIVAVLCGTGTGNNRGELDSYYGGYFGTVDYLPADVGLAIPQARLYAESFRPGYIRRPLPRIGGLALTTEDATDPAAWLEERILRPLHLALTTRKDGKIALVDLATVPDLDDAITLDCRQELRGQPGANLPSVSARWDVSGIVTGVRVTWHRAAPALEYIEWPTRSEIAQSAPWSAATRITVVVRGDTSDGGRTSIMRRISTGALESDPRWIVDSDELQDAIASAAGAYMQQQGIPRLALDMLVSESGGLIDVELGDIVALENCPIPGEGGTRGLAQYARVYGIRRNLLNATMALDMLVIGRTPQQPRWVASGVVTYCPSTTAIGIARNAFTVVNGRYDTDAEAFRIGDKLYLASATYTILSTNTPEITAIDADTDTITINAAFSDGSPISPEEGQIIILAERSAQIADSQTTRGWLDYGQAGLTAAQRTRWQ